VEIKIINDNGRKIAMIKELREIFKADLKESKEFVEALLKERNRQAIIPDRIIGTNNLVAVSVDISKSRHFRCVVDFDQEIRVLAISAISLNEFSTAKSLINILDADA
jgi:hypothetical protein